MKVRVFSACTASGLERSVNDFIATPGIKVLQIQFQASVWAVYAMITFEEAKAEKKMDAFANI